MKKLIAIGAIFFALTGAAFAQTLTIAAGQEGRGYDRFAKAAVQRLVVKDIPATVSNNAGSDEITDKVCKGFAQLGITQIDAVDIRSREGCKLAIVGSYGSEQAIILFPKDSPYDSLSDLSGSNHILVDDVGSGTDLFWHNIVSIETGENGNNSDWSKVKPVNDIFLAADGLASSKNIDAVLMVTTPDSETLAEMVANGWEIGDLYDKDINDYVYNGESLYTADSVDLGTKWGGGDEGDTYVVRSVVVANEEWLNTVKRSDRSQYAQILRVFTDLGRSR